MTFWFDVTTAAQCPPPAAGIPRTETRLAESLRAIGADVRFCLHEAQLRRFSEVRVDDFLRLVAARRAGTADPTRVEFDVHRLDRRDVGGAEVFGPRDVLVTCGFNWRSPQFGDMPRLHALAATIGLRVVTTCYDLIPLRHPHFAPGMAESYAPYIDDMLAHAAHVLCISRDTRGDLLRRAEERGLRTPPSSVLQLGCDLVAADRPVGDGVRALLERSFLLMVGTLEVRKNHETLCRAYGRLVEWGATDLPLLVFVGQIGAGGPELVRSIAADPRIRDRVVLLPAASDADLLALYRHCRFVVYPSLAEGWGLPVAEALAHGKFCIASDRTAIPEVGRDFVDYLDPWDVDAWAERIFRYLQLPASVARHEAGIRRDYRPPTWEATAAAVLDVVAGLG